MEAYQQWLPTIGWTYKVTLTTKYTLSSRAARRMMERLFNRLKSKVFNQERILMYWVAEKYKLKDGQHLHMLLQVPKGYKKGVEKMINNAYQIISAAYRNREYYRTDIQRFNPNSNGAKYFAKDLWKIATDFDILYQLSSDTFQRIF